MLSVTLDDERVYLCEPRGSNDQASLLLHFAHHGGCGILPEPQAAAW